MDRRSEGRQAAAGRVRMLVTAGLVAAALLGAAGSAHAVRSGSRLTAPRAAPKPVVRYPTGIALDARGRIYVTDSIVGQVQV